MTDTASIHAFKSDIPSQIHPSPITLELQSCLIHKYFPHFDCLIFLKTFLCKFLLVLLLAAITFLLFPAIYLVGTSADLFLYFQIKDSIFIRNSVFWF